MSWRIISTTWVISAVAVLGACGLQNSPPDWSARPGDQQQQQTNVPVYTKPLLDPTEAEGRICTDRAPVVGRAQPGSTVIASGEGGSATAQAGSDGRFCVAVPLAKGMTNRIEVYSVHPDFGDSEPVFVSLTHAGMACSSSSVSVPQEDEATPQTQEQRADIVQVQASVSPKEGSDRAMIDGDVNTYVWYQSWSLNVLQPRSDEMWVWFTLPSVAKIKGIRIRWRDSIGYGNMYAEKFYVGTSAAESPGQPPAPPTSGFILNAEVAPEPSEWEWISRYASMNPGGGLTEVDLASQLPAAQHVALWLEADAVDASFAEDFAISEVEILLYTPPQSGVSVAPTGSSSVCGIY